MCSLPVADAHILPEISSSLKNSRGTSGRQATNAHSETAQHAIKLNDTLVSDHEANDLTPSTCAWFEPEVSMQLMYTLQATQPTFLKRTSKSVRADLCMRGLIISFRVLCFDFCDFAVSSGRGRRFCRCHITTRRGDLHVISLQPIWLRMQKNDPKTSENVQVHTIIRDMGPWPAIGVYTMAGRCTALYRSSSSRVSTGLRACTKKCELRC